MSLVNAGPISVLCDDGETIGLAEVCARHGDQLDLRCERSLPIGAQLGLSQPPGWRAPPFELSAEVLSCAACGVEPARWMHRIALSNLLPGDREWLERALGTAPSGATPG